MFILFTQKGEIHFLWEERERRNPSYVHHTDQLSYPSTVQILPDQSNSQQLSLVAFPR